MKKLTKINLSDSSEILNDFQMKNILGGSAGRCVIRCSLDGEKDPWVDNYPTSYYDAVQLCGGSVPEGWTISCNC